MIKAILLPNFKNTNIIILFFIFIIKNNILNINLNL